MLRPELKAKIDGLPFSPGIYIYKDENGRVIYVGKSIRLRDRVKSYFVPAYQLGPKTARLVENIYDLETIETESEIEALILEAELIKKYWPEFNIQWKDDKGYKYIKVFNARFKSRRGIKKTVEANLWPWVTTSRKKDDPNALYFGPFPEGRTVTLVIKTLRRLFPWCQYPTPEKLAREKKACFYSHIRLCPGICAGRVTLEDYWRINGQLILFLQGKKKQVKIDMAKAMKQASNNMQFELAAEYRDSLERLDYVTQSFHTASDYIENPNLKQDQRLQEVSDLTSRLNFKPFSYEQLNDFRIEGYDISNWGKDFAVASQVTFIGGEASKSDYRQYRIRREKLPDDFAAMKEVITRRLKNGKNLPNLFLIDGGKGQLSTVLGVLHSHETNIQAIGLAKKFETIIVPYENSFAEVSLTRDAPALKLLMRIRDESHRFAQRYHKLLRQKSLTSLKKIPT